MRTTPSEVHDTELAAASQIRRGATMLAARARVERAGELSLNQTAVLGLLLRGGAMTPGEIAERMRVRPQSLTRAFAVIEERGWVSRMSDVRDGRQSLLSITAKGHQALSAEMRPRDVWLAHVVAETLTEAERDLLVIAGRLMERLAYVDTSPAPVEP